VGRSICATGVSQCDWCAWVLDSQLIRVTIQVVTILVTLKEKRSSP